MSQTPRPKKLRGEEALEAAYQAVDHQTLLDALGVQLEDDVLRLALTHRSFANEQGMLPNNERLEFLGDAVLGLSVASKLYVDYPTRPESDISKMRAAVVSGYSCAEIGREIGLGEHMILGRGELLTDGRNKDSILADAVEALLGAVYLQYGWDAAEGVVLRLFAEKIATASAKGFREDWKTALQERLAELKLPLPEYSFTTTGPEHELVFSVVVRIAGIEMGQGEGHNKKTAEQHAARTAHRELLDAAYNGLLMKLRKAAEEIEAGQEPGEDVQAHSAADATSGDAAASVAGTPNTAPVKDR